MKRFALSLILGITGFLASFGMNFQDAQQQAYFLTDKMAYELNLNEYQYDQVYQVNLEYFLNMNHYNDINGVYWTYRDLDLGYILYDWQWNLYRAADYFYRPIRWYRNSWYFSIWDRYRRDYFFYGRPTIWNTWRGGLWHGRQHHTPSPFVGRRHDEFRGGMNKNFRGNGGHNPGGHMGNGGNHNPGGFIGNGGNRGNGGNYNGGNHNNNRNNGGNYNGGNHNNNRNNGGNYNGGNVGGNRNNGGGYNGGNAGGNRNNGGNYSGGNRGNSNSGSRGGSVSGGSRGGSSVSGSRGGNAGGSRGGSSTSGGGRSFGGGRR